MATLRDMIEQDLEATKKLLQQGKEIFQGYSESARHRAALEQVIFLAPVGIGENEQPRLPTDEELVGFHIGRMWGRWEAAQIAQAAIDKKGD